MAAFTLPEAVTRSCIYYAAPVGNRQAFRTIGVYTFPGYMFYTSSEKKHCFQLHLSREGSLLQTKLSDSPSSTLPVWERSRNVVTPSLDNGQPEFHLLLYTSRDVTTVRRIPDKNKVKEGMQGTSFL